MAGASDMCSEVLLKTSDGKTVSVDRNVIRKSILIEDMIQGCSQKEESGDSKIFKEAPPLVDIDEVTLMKVLEWCEHHKNDGTFITTNEDGDEVLPDELPEWDQKYLQMEPNLLFDVVLAANFLDIRDLLEMACKTIAEKMKGRTPEELRIMFNIENDLTEEELKKIDIENSWCEGW